MCWLFWDNLNNLPQSSHCWISFSECVPKCSLKLLSFIQCLLQYSQNHGLLLSWSFWCALASFLSLKTCLQSRQLYWRFFSINVTSNRSVDRRCFIGNISSSWSSPCAISISSFRKYLWQCLHVNEEVLISFSFIFKRLLLQGFESWRQLSLSVFSLTQEMSSERINTIP